ncbi:MAG: tetratricopeptide repeat protein [Planctomycetes bacterium]|nr:tetratricopeptide repeat protein [Planctomycetota bacterium]
MISRRPMQVIIADRSARNPFRAASHGGIRSAFRNHEDENPPGRRPQKGFWGQRLLLISWLLAMPLASARADIRPLLLDAEGQFTQNRFEQALKLYKQADEAEPDHPAVWYNMGLCHMELGDGDKAIQQFEKAASQSGVPAYLKQDAFYNIGLARAASARQKLNDLMAPATQPTDRKPAPDDPANIENLKKIADEFLLAIAAFRQARDVGPDDDTEHNIRAARIIRRNVLGLLQRAAEAKEKEDILKDPRAYLESLIAEQDQQVSLTRYLVIRPPDDPGAVRHARRTAIRGQRKLMERTGELADQLAQYRQQQADAPAPSASQPSTQPAEQTPLEKAYRAASAQLRKAVDSQKDACAFLLDGEIKPGWDKQFAALEQMYGALFLYPLEPAPALAKAKAVQQMLRELVAEVKKTTDWLSDPLLGDVEWPKDAEWDADKTSIFVQQAVVGGTLAMLQNQFRFLSTRPADEEQAPQEQQENPMLDRELNEKLSKIMEPAPETSQRCLKAIMDRNRKDTLAAQDELLKMIDEAMELLPRTVEQRLQELIAKQAELNSQVKAESGDESADESTKPSPLDEIRKWAAELKTRLLAPRASKVADGFRERQEKIQKDGGKAAAQIREEIPAEAASQPAGAPPTSQPSRVQALIEAGKHVAADDEQMTQAIEGLNRASVENSRKPLKSGGPVQVPQAKALEELVKALMALQPPQSQPQDDQQDQQDRQQQEQQRDRQEIQREIEQAEKQRQEAERQLHQRRPRTVIKDW